MRGSFKIGLKTIICLAALTIFAIGNAMAATRVVDPDETGCAEGDAFYDTITDAVDASFSGDIIDVCDGIYNEAFVIFQDSLTLQSVNPLGATIQAPETLTPGGAIIEVILGDFAPVTGASTVSSSGVVIDGFKIAGPGIGGACSINMGVYVHEDATATVSNNTIVSIRDDPLSVCQTGYGIRIGNGGGEGSDPGTGTLTGNTISDYQKGGILVDGSGSSAVITNNTITGAGKTQVIAQNGVEIARTSLASMISGNTINNNSFDNSGIKCSKLTIAPGSDLLSSTGCGWTATGALEFQAGVAGDKGKILKHNKFHHNQTNVVVSP